MFVDTQKLDLKEVWMFYSIAHKSKVMRWVHTWPYGNVFKRLLAIILPFPMGCSCLLYHRWCLSEQWTERTHTFTQDPRFRKCSSTSWEAPLENDIFPQVCWDVTQNLSCIYSVQDMLTQITLPCGDYSHDFSYASEKAQLKPFEENLRPFGR